jgi:glycogen debranching enzyme
MPLEIAVGPPQLAVHVNRTAWIADPDGQVRTGSQKGLIFRDTRLVSAWELYADGEPWDLLNGGAIEHYAGRVHLTNRRIVTEDGEIPTRTLGLVLARWIEHGVHEDIDITNHGRNRAHFHLELVLRADFADIFEVKSGSIVRRGHVTTNWEDGQRQCLRTAYTNQDFRRELNVTLRGDSPAVNANGRLSFEIELAPGAIWHTCLLYELVDGDEHLAAPTDCIHDCAWSMPARRLAGWRDETLVLRAADEEFTRIFGQAVDDLAALRMTFPGEGGVAEHEVPAAGLPWFLALFGRDSLIVSILAAPVHTRILAGTLHMLGKWQALERDDWRDAEPGKILHELRQGELAHFHRIPHTPYYGTADATPLYLVALHEAWRWTGDLDFVRSHLPVAERCLTWIDDWGDRDGDGFQEYERRLPTGYENMGWKDAEDAVLWPDGSMVENPKALCELQGYVFAAWQGMAELFDALGETARADDLRAKASVLYDRFNDVFWNEEAGLYAFALDGRKRQVLTVASNIGHCLWSGIIRPDRARRVMQRLTAPDMLGPWGIRTLSSRHPAFNPISYHDGSVWPHDNGIIAMGFARYGFTAEAARIARAVTGAAGFFALHQVPELYAGIGGPSAFPVQCLGANVPQAWAAASSFAFLRALLRLEPDATNNRLGMAPALPDWLPEITLTGLRLGAQMLDLRITREGTDTNVAVLRGDPDTVQTNHVPRALAAATLATKPA